MLRIPPIYVRSQKIHEIHFRSRISGNFKTQQNLGCLMPVAKESILFGGRYLELQVAYAKICEKNLAMDQGFDCMV